MALRGRDTTISLSTGPLAQVLEGDDVVSFKWEARQKVTNLRFFGNTSDTHLETYQDVRIELELNHLSPAVIQFITNMSARGRLDIMGMVVKITTKYKMPNGETSKILFDDVKFENMPMVSGSREDNVVTPLVGYCKLAEPLTSII